jgi:hypothetical protein
MTPIGIELERALVGDPGGHDVAGALLGFAEAVVGVGGSWKGIDVQREDANRLIGVLFAEQEVPEGIELVFADLVEIGVRRLEGAVPL